jgi:hypothetical protein
MEDQDSSTGRRNANVESLRITEASLVPFVCPLYAPDPFGTPYFQGSSVLLQVGSLHLLITAAHVLRDAGRSLFIAGPTLQVEPLKYVREVAEEKWDFAILELDEESVKHMTNFSFWQVGNCDPQ